MKKTKNLVEEECKRDLALWLHEFNRELEPIELLEKDKRNLKSTFDITKYPDISDTNFLDSVRNLLEYEWIVYGWESDHYYYSMKLSNGKMVEGQGDSVNLAYARILIEGIINSKGAIKQ